MSQTIRAITVIANPTRCFEVGCEYGGQIITEIKDVSCEWENSIDFVYHVMNENGHLIASIENCPVIAEYKKVAQESDQ